MNDLHPDFPGGTRKSSLGDYRCFLVGDIFHTYNIGFGAEVFSRLEAASLELGKFAAKITELPTAADLIAAFSKKEATLSSRIEGTQTGVEEAFLPDDENVDPEKRDDWLEVRYYINALDKAIAGLEKVPVSGRLIKDTHKVLLNQPRGKNKMPGEYRSSQNWIGGSRPDNARFVPLSPEYVSAAMSNLEKFIHDTQQSMPHLIRIALVHYQFETIHPFLDGNGRIGRMLIPLYLMEKKILHSPIFYISAYFERNRQAYYDGLGRARQNTQGISDWVLFFLDAVYATAAEGIATTQRILDLKQDITERRLPALGGRARNAKRLLDHLFIHPVNVNSVGISRALNFSVPLTQQLLADFMNLKILREKTGKKRNRLFIFDEYIKLLED